MSTVCPNGHPNRSGAKFCSVCGARIAGEAVAAFPPAAPAPYSDAGAPPVPNEIAEVEQLPQLPGPVRFPFGLIPTLPGMLIVAAGFFMDWLVVSSPAGSFLTLTSAPETLSGMKLVTTAPGGFSAVPTAIVCLVPGLALGALFLTIMTALRIIPLRWLLSLLQLGFAAIGIIFMVALFTQARALPEQLVGNYGLSGNIASLLASALVKIDPGVGLYATVFGFILIGLGAFVDFLTQLIWR